MGTMESFEEIRQRNEHRSLGQGSTSFSAVTRCFGPQSADARHPA